MISHLTNSFVQNFDKLPDYVKVKARKNYKLWKRDQSHPGLQFKKVHPAKPIWAVRIGIGWRAVGIRESDTIIWFWIGSHSAYNKLLKQL